MHGRLYFGCVESRTDPLMLGRCKVRCVGLHTDNKTDLPTEDLPWATPLQPITSAAVSGIGSTPLGPVEGTWVAVSFLDDAMQYPIMVGSIAGIPGDFESLESISTSDDQQTQSNSVSTGSGGNLVDGSGNIVSSGVDSDDLSLIPRSPPKGSTSNVAAATAGINALIQGCVSVGITNRNAICSILGIVGKESQWIPKSEMYLYTDLSKTFPDVTAEQNEKYNKKSGASRNQVFSFLYGVSSSSYSGGRIGKNLGNLSDEDGGKYYGRGFIQITGRSNYAKYGTLSGLNLVGDPEILNSDLVSSAKVAALYFKDRVSVPQTESGYFDYALKAVGGDKSGFSDKRKYYEYFLGGQQPTSNAQPTPVPSKSSVEKKNASAPTKSQKTGFNDPNGKYPKYYDEPDTNRLARKMNLGGTVYQLKKNDLTQNVSIANSGTTWSQLRIPYNAKYPFNHVYESETGHIIEIDDSPGAERLHVYHKSGSFTEIDAEGNKSEKVKGASTNIVDEDCLIYIKGAKHQSIGNDGSIVIGGQLQIQVSGNANISVGGSVYQSVGGDYNIVASGNFNVDAAQIFLNSGAATAGHGYSPTITQPHTLTIEEAQYIDLEETDRRTQLFNDDNQSIEEEKSDLTPPPKPLPITSTECNFVDDLTYETQLTDHFKLGDLCFESGRQFPFTVGQHQLTDKEIACNLKHLCLNVLEPLYEKYNDIGFKLNSGFRLKKKTSKVSQHELGEAADISFKTIRGNGSFDQQCERFYQIAIEIRDSGIPFDQLIFEVDPGKGYVWIHISYSTKRLRREVLTFVGSGYKPGILKIVSGVIQSE